ncbi:sensor histidine kinase [Paenibacillus daejeonensis]|uniref:sensor histidine kinase n=1 Tax=Paenibacillus daejeonensis TaxID=135193 RepID=UPI00036F9F62|nr:sensor histidine kinase [Paenibacillus daejeonensis]
MDKRNNFKDSIRRMVMRYTLVPISLLFLLFLVFTIINARLILVNQTKEAGTNIRISLESVYGAYWEESERMAKLPEVIRFTESGVDSYLVYEAFYAFNNAQDVRSMMHIMNRDGEMVASSAGQLQSAAETALQAIVTRMSRMTAAELSETNVVRYAHDRYTAYTVAREIRSGDTRVGYLIYQLYDEDFQKLIFRQNNEIAIVTDRYNTVIATTNNIVKGLLGKFRPSYDESGYVRIGDGRYYMNEAAISGGQWKIYTLNAIQTNAYRYLSLAVFFVIASLLLWFLIRYLARVIASRQSRAVDKLIHAVHQLQRGNLQSFVYIGTGDEFETLANQYNIMLKRLNELMHKNEELSELRQVIEVKHLQSQFHPHFIFNVLETLKYAIVVDNRQAQDIVLILSRLLRYSICTDGATVPLQEDLNYVADYLRLQQIRFKERLTYTLTVNENAGEALVPRLLLQAVIENSIKYGYRAKECLHIEVEATVVNGELEVTILDNGGGMSVERLKEVQSILAQEDNRSPHIGLYNLHRRLVLLYGEPYGIAIDHAPADGVSVVIRIPYHV